MDGQLVALLDDPLRLVDPREVDARVDALGQQVQGQRDEVDVPGALAVPEQRPLDALRSRHQPQLRRRDRRAAVVVRMDADDDRVARGDVPAEPLDPVGVDVRRELLDGRRQVDDHLRLGRRPPRRDHGLADLERVVELGAVEALGRVLVDDLGAGLRRELLAERRAAHREVGDPGPVEAEHHAALDRRGRVVEVDDRPPRTLDRLEGPLDQLRTGLREHGDRDVRGDQVVLDEPPAELEVGRRGGREADLDLLVAELEQEVEHLPLALGVHRVDERLVPVAQVGRAPARRAGQHPVGPGAVGQVYGLELSVLAVRHRHGASLRLRHGRRTAPSGCGAHGHGYVDDRSP